MGLGCVEFKEIDSSGNYVFERNQKDFEPREVDQPLRSLLTAEEVERLAFGKHPAGGTVVICALPMNSEG